MTAFGQPGPAAPAPTAGTPPPAAGAPAGGTAPAPNADPFGFSASVATAPEHLRPMLQQHFETLTPQLQERFGVYEPLQPLMERLTPLLTPDPETGSNTLEGLLELYSMFQDPARSDTLAEWWDQVGEEFGFFEDDETLPAGAAAAPGAPAAAGDLDLSGVDPQLATVIQGLQQQVKDQAAQVAELTNGLSSQQQEQAATQEATRIRGELVAGMQAAGIPGHEDVKSEQASDILRLAISYGEDPEAITKAVTRYAQLTGARPPENPGGVDSQLSGVAALQAALSGGGIATSPSGGGAGHGAALGRGNADTEPEAIQGWDNARAVALRRLQTAGAMG